MMNKEEKIKANKERMDNFWRDYQWKFIEDESPFIVYVKSRRIGISEAAIYKAIKKCLSRPYHMVYMSSFALREAKELIRRTEMWVNMIIPSCTGKSLGTKCKKTMVEFPNGSRIEALPADKIRSRGGTIILDEFAFYQNAKDTLSAIMPATLTNDDLQVIVISTPLGDKGEFYDIVQGAKHDEGPYRRWNLHETDIYKAVNMGFNVDIEDIKKDYLPEIFAQEFECAFTSDVDQYFSNDLLRNCLYDEIPDDDLRQALLFGGLDLAESVDASAMSTIIQDDDQKWVKEPTFIKEPGVRRDFSDQEKDVFEILDRDPYHLVSVDAAGNGSATAQVLKKKYGSTIRKVDSGKWRKVYDRIPYMKEEMEKKTLLLPQSRELLRDFRSIQKKTLSNRKATYEAKRTADGHADSFYSTLLAYDAYRSLRCQASSVKTRTRTRIPQSRKTHF